MSDYNGSRMQRLDAIRPGAPTPGMNARDQRYGKGISVKPEHIGRKARKAHVRPFRPGKDDWKVTATAAESAASEGFNPDASMMDGRTRAEDELLAAIGFWNSGADQNDTLRATIEHGLARLQHRDFMRASEFRAVWRG